MTLQKNVKIVKKIDFLTIFTQSLPSRTFSSIKYFLFNFWICLNIAHDPNFYGRIEKYYFISFYMKFQKNGQKVKNNRFLAILSIFADENFLIYK